MPKLVTYLDEFLQTAAVSFGTDDCWPYERGVGKDGYVHTRLRGKRGPAHRLAYELLRGPIPPGLTLDHLCRVRNCVNPAHLEPVTMRENVLRGTAPAAQNAAKTHCVRGHALDDENTYWQRHRGRWCRQCSTCRKERDRQRWSDPNGRARTHDRARKIAERAARRKESEVVSRPAHTSGRIGDPPSHESEAASLTLFERTESAAGLAMSVRSVSPPTDRGHSYAWWSGRLAALLGTLLRDPDDELHRKRAENLLLEFDVECRRREALIGDPGPLAPQSIRAELAEIAARPEEFFGS